jgi:hypothetical protein
VLCCVVMCCVVLCGIALYRVVLYRIEIYWILLDCIQLFSNVYEVQAALYIHLHVYEGVLYISE